MLPRIRLLTLTVSATVGLLSLGAFLVVLGIFNESLEWGIFGPKIEAVLYGVFGTSVALAAFGVATTLVLGIQEIAQAFRALQRERSGEPRGAEPSWRRYGGYVVVALVVLAVTVGGLSLLNARIQQHRDGVFKRLAADQMQHFAPQLVQQLARFTPSTETDVPREFADLLETLGELDFISTVSVFVAEPQGPALLRYSPAGDYEPGKEPFTRLFIARDSDKAIRQALEGQTKPLDDVIESTKFVYAALAKNPDGQTVAVLRIGGNARDNLREYSLGE